MSIKSMVRSSVKAAGNLFGTGSHIHTALDIFKVLKGGEKPADNAHAAVKGLHGVLGYGDERELEVLLQKLDADKPGSRDIITGFFRWHFKSTTGVQKVLTWWYGNAFRSFISKMGSSEGPLCGKEVTTVTSKAVDSKKATKVVTTKDLRGDRTDNALNFLEMMVDTITSETSVTKGYKKLIKQFEAMNTPHVPRSSEKTILAVSQYVETTLIDGSRDAKAGLIRHTRRAERQVRLNQQKPRSLLDRFIGI